MLPDPAVLPGTGWRVVAENEFSDDARDDDDSMWSDECDVLIAELFEPIADVEKQFKGRGQKTYELAAGGRPANFALTLEVTTQLYGGRGEVEKDVELVARALGDSRSAKCYAAAWEGHFSAPAEDGTMVDFDVEGVAALADAPRHGSAWAFEGKIHETGEPWLRLEEYQWAVGNATIYLWVLGDVNDVTPDFVEAVLARLDGSALVAARKK